MSTRKVKPPMSRYSERQMDSRPEQRPHDTCPGHLADRTGTAVALKGNAELLGDVTLVATYRQLARWTERGMIKRVRTGRYAAITPTKNPLRDLWKR